MRLLIIDPDESVRKSAAVALESAGHQTVGVARGAEALRQLKQFPFDAAFVGLELEGENGLDVMALLRQAAPQMDVIALTSPSAPDKATEALRRGANDLVPRPFTPDQLRHAVVQVTRARKLECRVADLESRIASESPPMDFTAADPIVQRTFDLAWRAATTPAPILLLGESGTGKTVLARAIHQNSPQKEGPFVTVTCLHLSGQALESELFGHVKGAFAGALGDKVGKVSAASSGTLFLDEIGELPLETQPKLLRLLQDKEYETLGENKARPANVRVMAATNRDLEAATKAGRFREDLFYRLNVISLQLTPLRQRLLDLPKFAAAYLRFFARQCGKRIDGVSISAAEAMRHYAWPGNLRELRNLMERAVILAASKRIELADLPENLNAPQEGADRARVQLGARLSLEDIEREHIRLVMSRSDTLEEAAHVLAIDPATLYRKRKQWGL